MHVSVPGIYKNPAPYREQIFTYSTGLALTGRSAACAPLMASRPAAEPRIRLLTIFMLTSKLCFVQKPVQSGIDCPRNDVEDQRILVAQVDLSEPPRTGRPRDAPLRRNITITDGLCTRNKGTAQDARVPAVFGRVLHK